MADTKFNFTETSNTDLIKFELINSTSSFANAIRRCILDDVETIAFKTEPFHESHVNIIENTSSLHNEFLLHRIGMIPINYPDMQNFNPDKYRFVLDVENTSSKIIDITTQNFKIIYKEKLTQASLSLFKKNI